MTTAIHWTSTRRTCRHSPTSKAAAEATNAANAAAAAAAEAAEAAIKAAQESAAQAAQTLGSALADAMQRATEAAAAFRALNESLLLSDESTLNAEQKYAEAKRQFEHADADTLQEAEKAFLEASKAWFGNTASYAADFAAVLARNNKEAIDQDRAAAAIPLMWQNHLAGQNSVNGSHATGLDAVPFDNYRAILHKDERVQTSSQVVDERRRGAELVRLMELQLEQARLDKVQYAAGITATLASFRKLGTKIDKVDRGIRAAQTKTAERA